MLVNHKSLHTHTQTLTRIEAQRSISSKKNKWIRREERREGEKEDEEEKKRVCVVKDAHIPTHKNSHAWKSVKILSE